MLLLTVVESPGVVSVAVGLASSAGLLYDVMVGIVGVAYAPWR